MFGEIRPDFEVVKEGRILHFVLGDRRFVVNDRIIQGVADSSPAGPTMRTNQLEFYSDGWFFVGDSLVTVSDECSFFL
jgi:sugar lactone lactonase YvrE